MKCYIASFFLFCGSLALIAGYCVDPIPVSYRYHGLEISYGKHPINQETLTVLEKALRRG